MSWVCVKIWGLECLCELEDLCDAGLVRDAVLEPRLGESGLSRV